MRKMVILLKPFEYAQKVFILEDGNKIDFLETTIPDLIKSSFSLIEKYEVSQVDLSGPKQFSKGIAENINEYALTDYGKMSFDINII